MPWSLFTTPLPDFVITKGTTRCRSLPMHTSSEGNRISLIILVIMMTGDGGLLDKTGLFAEESSLSDDFGILLWRAAMA